MPNTASETCATLSVFDLEKHQRSSPNLNTRATPTNNMEANQYLAFANRFFQAYNDVDTQTIRDLVSDDIHFEHHSRFSGQGKEKLLDQIQNFSKIIPGRYFTEPTRWAVNGDVIFVEHTAHGTPVADIAVFGWKAGESVAMDCCSLLVLKDGKIVEWSDFA